MKPCCLTFAVNVKKQPEAIKSCGLNKHGIILTAREGVREVESIKVMLMKPSEYTRSITIEIESEGEKIARFPEKV